MTYTLYELDRAIARFDNYLAASHALMREIKKTANTLKGLGYSREERVVEARKVWRIETEAGT